MLKYVILQILAAFSMYLMYKPFIVVKSSNHHYLTPEQYLALITRLRRIISVRRIISSEKATFGICSNYKYYLKMNCIQRFKQAFLYTRCSALPSANICLLTFLITKKKSRTKYATYAGKGDKYTA